MAFNPPPHLLFNELRLALTPIKETDQFPIDHLSEADFHRLENLRTPSRKVEFFAARKALASATALERLSELHYQGKKPHLHHGYLSMSHGSGLAAATYSDHLEVGIDIESTRPQLLRIQHKFVREDERSLLEALGPQRGLQFLWGIKESLFKLYGHGGVEFIDHLHVISLERQSNGWYSGMAWIYATCSERLSPIQCLVQCYEDEGTYLCLATHRAPMIPLLTERLLIRQWVPEDGNWLYELNADPEVILYTGDTGFSSPQAALLLILNYPNYQRDGFGRWMVEDRTTGQPLGWCGLKQNPWGVDLGFRYFKSSWNKGIATEAGEAVLQWARENKIKGIVGRALSGNVASVRVLKKLGFQEFSRHSMQDFADEHPIPQHDYENWLDQQVIMHKIDL
ncbi:MAG: hypothetical protein RL754_1157 [Bacteroidota bacterium]|jgi:RimJ/RimL family protein N-acetyltransferase/phosphopantetheinyl transferase